MKDLHFEKFIPPSKRGVPMKRRALENTKKASPELVPTKTCPFEKEFAEHREEYVEQTLNTKRLAALETLRGVVEREIEQREKTTGFFDEAKAWEHIKAALKGCQ